ncbi:GHMP kinase [Treponema sp. OMZ 799]|uniref:galactokinase n=1 Tax=Treponema sp. OMZ 799 TaxID=2563668 RepID=UPI0020A318D8|nr:galactokinase family protein [Treponema sp. OMZ 799]UTC76908.1 GHMP kinase [Treponema sp. OMZ 799]
MNFNVDTKNLEDMGEGELKLELKKLFDEIYGASPEEGILIASPVSLTLMGEELDYNGGNVLNLCFNKSIYFFIKKNNTDKISFTDLLLNKKFEGFISGQAEKNQKPDSVQEEGSANLIFDIILLTVQKINKHFENPLSGFDILVFDKVRFKTRQTSLPAFEAGFCTGLLSLFKLKENFKTIASLCLEAEHEVLNTKRGLSNQISSFSAKQETINLFDSRDLSFLSLPLNLGEYGIVLIGTRSNREAYRASSNIRYMECEEGLHILQKKLDLDHLCEITEADYTYYKPSFFDKTILRRVKHCITENARVSKAVKALKNGDMDLLGKLLCESHISMRDDFELMSTEQNILFETAIIQSGCRGAKLIGNTEGCYILALVKKEAMDEFYLEVHKRYFEKTGDSPEFFEFKSSGGIRIL